MSLREVRREWAKNKKQVRDIHHHDRKLDGERLRLERETFPERDKQLITEYVRYLEAQNLSKVRLAKAMDRHGKIVNQRANGNGARIPDLALDGSEFV